MRIVSIDPGKWATAWATFQDGGMEDCGYTRGKTVEEMLEAMVCLGLFADEVVVEITQVYRYTKKPKDCIDVAFSAGLAAATIRTYPQSTTPEIITVTPHGWKKDVPKDIHNKRTLKKLNRDELAILDDIDVPPSLRHNVIDAIGIGLWRLKR